MAKNGFRLIDAEMHVMEPVAFGLGDRSKQKILWDNALRLYAL